MGCLKLSYYEQESALEVNSIFFGGALEKKGNSDFFCLKAYRYGFNGKEKDQAGEWGLNAYDYGFRIYNPAIGKFLSVDPLTRNFPWNSTYAYAENDVIRSIDLDGLEKVAVTESPVNAGRIKSLFKTQNYRKINEIIEYSSTHGWVDSEGKPSDYIERKYIEQHGSKGPGISKGSSAMIFNDLYVDEGLVEQYGDINDHGGYMKVQFFNWETNEYENLGTVPLSKINENQRTKVVEGLKFFDLEAEYSSSDILRESGERLKMMVIDIAKLFIKTARDNPQIIDLDGINNQKVKFAIEGRLRKIGPNSEYRQPIYDRGQLLGIYKVNYQIDEKGNETFTESYNK